jgi:hypothetical protein
MDEVSADGSAELNDGGSIKIEFAYHNGDQAVLRAKPDTSSTDYTRLKALASALRDARRLRTKNLAIEQTTGRQRLNIHGAIDLETGHTTEAIDSASAIKLLAAIEALYSTAALLVHEWLSQPGRRSALHFVPSCCSHLSSIERLWAPMHEHLTHNKTYHVLGIRRCHSQLPTRRSPRKWGEFCESVTDNFRVNPPANFRILA